jgi:hypothetical protein
VIELERLGFAESDVKSIEVENDTTVLELIEKNSLSCGRKEIKGYL